MFYECDTYNDRKMVTPIKTKPENFQSESARFTIEQCYINIQHLAKLCNVFVLLTRNSIGLFLGCPENAKSLKSQAPQGFSGCLDIENDELNIKKILSASPRVKQTLQSL